MDVGIWPAIPMGQDNSTLQVIYGRNEVAVQEKLRRDNI